MARMRRKGLITNGRSPVVKVLIFPRKKALFIGSFFAIFMFFSLRSVFSCFMVLSFFPSHSRRHVEDGEDDGEYDDGGHAAY